MVDFKCQKKFLSPRHLQIQTLSQGLGINLTKVGINFSIFR